MPPVISVEHLSKVYRLGQIGTPFQANAFTGPAASTFTPFGKSTRRGETANDLKLWWAKTRGKVTSGTL